MKVSTSVIRRAAQIFFFSLLVYIVWNTAFPLNNFLNPAFYFYMDPLAMFITGIAERVLLSGMLFAAAMIILTAVTGRFFCGWICPLGASIDFISWITIPLAKKIKTFTSTGKSSPFRYLKYLLLALIFLAAIPGYQAAWLLDPITIFVRTFSLNIQPGVNQAVESIFAIVQPESEIGTGIYSFFQQHILTPDLHEFAHSRIFLYLFTAILVLTLARRRFWCRYVCPLGAMFAVPSKVSILERERENCPGGCTSCVKICRMNAIREDRSYDKQECILCFDCTDRCPGGHSKFSFRKNISLIKQFFLRGKNSAAETGSADSSMKKISDDKENPASAGVSFGASMTRRTFAVSLISAAGALIPAAGYASSLKIKKGFPLRPPGALKGDHFIQRCIRCGNCMKVCPTSVIRPASAASGLGSLWSPYLDPLSGYCEYLCNLCGVVCPTGAIEKMSIEKKTAFVIGTAVINKKTCLPWAKNENCIVCEEHCPVSDKAIKLETRSVGRSVIKYPVVDEKLCIGCAICENKCPVNPVKGINVFTVE